MNLIQQITHFGEYPLINLSAEELRKIIIKQFNPKSNSFNFQTFTTNNILSYLKDNNLGLIIPPNTTYTGGLNKGDCSRAREIIWDLIIERYLTIGSYGEDSWPNFSITERGHAYFKEFNNSTI
ncbi:MAG: hypothetical protein EOP48_11830 [Sphingobacteriales bacterium]|nr:MAG: hypothetical protein EOP48_11830 [Sphingobacteriales bacterium]